MSASDSPESKLAKAIRGSSRSSVGIDVIHTRISTDRPSQFFFQLILGDAEVRDASLPRAFDEVDVPHAKQDRRSATRDRAAPIKI